MTMLDDETRMAVQESVKEIFTRGADAGDLRSAIRDLGWQEIVDIDASASSILFEAQGRALAASSLLDDVVLEHLDPLLGGEARRAVLYPVDLADGEPSRDRAVGNGIVLGPLDSVDEIVVATCGDLGVMISAINVSELKDAPLSVTAFDRGSGWLAVQAPVEAGRSVAAGDSWSRAIAAGRRAIASEMVGVCQQALDIAVAHTSARAQYGRPLATFQSVRHALSEAHAAIESLRVLLEAAWAEGLSEHEAASAATVLKIRAGDVQAIVMRRTVQVLGAMGMTLESDMHRFVTRAAVLDQLLGGHRQLAEELGCDLLSGVPASRLVAI